MGKLKSLLIFHQEVFLTMLHQQEFIQTKLVYPTVEEEHSSSHQYTTLMKQLQLRLVQQDQCKVQQVLHTQVMDHQQHIKSRNDLVMHQKCWYNMVVDQNWIPTEIRLWKVKPVKMMMMMTSQFNKTSIHKIKLDLNSIFLYKPQIF